MNEQIKIGQTMYAVHDKYGAGKENVGAKIIICKVKTFQNVRGKVVPILREVGEKREFNTNTHRIYSKIDDALKEIA